MRMWNDISDICKAISFTDKLLMYSALFNRPYSIGPIQRGQYPVSSEDNCSSVEERDHGSHSDDL